MLSPIEARELLLHRLAQIVDEDRPAFARRFVIAEVQEMLQPGHPLRAKTPAELLALIKNPWDTKPVKNEWGRFEQRRVVRPLPESLADVW